MRIFNNLAAGATRAAAALAFLLLVSSLTIIASRPAEAAEQGAGDEIASQADYVIGADDILEVSVWKNAELSKIVTVRPDGKISLPLLGDMQASGLTPDQLRAFIIAKLKEYKENAVVSVIVQTVNSYRIFIVGDVVSPGTYQLKSKTSVLQAISLAGGFNQFASKNSIVVIRPKDGGAGEERFTIRFKDIVYNDRPGTNMILKPGDTIFVP